MATNNVEILDVGGHNVVPTIKWNTEAGTTDINAGEPVVIGSARNFAAAAGTGTPVIGTDEVIGLAQNASTQTASVDGVVDVLIPLPGVVYSVKATTGSNVDSDAKIAALVGKRVLFDLTAGVYTVDTSVADGVTNGVEIVGGNAEQERVSIIVRSSGTTLN